MLASISSPNFRYPQKPIARYSATTNVILVFRTPFGPPISFGYRIWFSIGRTYSKVSLVRKVLFHFIQNKYFDGTIVVYLSDILPQRFLQSQKQQCQKIRVGDPLVQTTARYPMISTRLQICSKILSLDQLIGLYSPQSKMAINICNKITEINQINATIYSTFYTGIQGHILIINHIPEILHKAHGQHKRKYHE